MTDELYKAFVTMLWYYGYDEQISQMFSKIKDTDEHIPYSEENGFSNEVWSIFVLMFGSYGTSPTYGWIEKVAEFKTFLQKIYDDMTKDDPVKFSV